MNLNGIEFQVLDVYDQSVTIPDSYVINENKTGKGHGEAKLYMGPKDAMRQFYTGDCSNEGFIVKCFVLKKDLISLLKTIKHEYYYPSAKYRGMGENNNMSKLWNLRMKDIQSLSDMVYFDIKDQNQIMGVRGYVNSTRKQSGYDLIRKLALPFVSYISVMKVQNVESQEILFYWRPFADFTQMASMQYAAQNYGKGKQHSESKQRKKQLQYREELFNEYHYCPFTHIDEFRLLIASHIKPYAVSNKKEQSDPNNGIMLSPLYDKLFDKGFISFDEQGNLLISDWLSPQNRNRIVFNYSLEDLRLNDERKKYLEYHRENVFK
ncbi:MAG: HNH endonuclease [Bacteroidales bacterium]|nr:HNH endonuclease [Bacteroidales bacterium]